MWFQQKTLNLNSYARWSLCHVLTSQFLYTSPNFLPKIKRAYANIQTKKHKKMHYFYVWLLTGQRPRLTKFNVSWKNNSQINVLKAKPKRQRVDSKLKNKYLFSFLQHVLWQIITRQTHAEKKVLIFKKLDVQLKIFAVPLTQNTFALQASNSYLPNIPLTLQFRFSYTTAFEKLFLLRALKLLSHDSKLKALDSFE